MKYINTTFAHGNGPYSRCVEWAIEVNNVREERRLKRLPVVVPLTYPGRQERIMREEIGTNVCLDFFEKYPNEIWLDRGQGKSLEKLMFKGKDYADNLRLLTRDYQGIEDEIRRYLDGKRELENFVSGKKETFDLRDIDMQLGLNNRINTGMMRHNFYTAGGAGPFDELLERAIEDSDVTLDSDAMRAALPVARRMIENQKIIFSNEPGVFSYDSERELRDKEVMTPPFIHPPKLDSTELPRKGVYLTMTGIDGVREGGMYNAVVKLGMQIYAPKFAIENLPDEVRENAIALNPSQINNSRIVAQYARGGWSSIWLSHMAEKGFITSPYQQGDDPEMIFNERGMVNLGLGVVIRDNPKRALEESFELSKRVGEHNQKLIDKYGTLDGIRYTAERVVDHMENI